MNDKAEKLKELVDGLNAFEKEFREALDLEPVVARPLHEAACEARRRYKTITEAHE